MKIKYIPLSFLISFLISLGNIAAQNCPDTLVNLSSQQQINDFATDYPGCTEFDFSIVIQSSFADEIQNLNGLIQIKKINGDLIILDNKDLISLAGLDSLNYVEELHIVFNSDLQQIDELNKLNNCELVVIQLNENLQNITGFQSLQQISNNLIVFENFNLSTINGFNELQHIDGNLRIRNNSNLINIDGFNSLQNIGQSIDFDFNPRLPDLKALSTINHIGANININDNYALTDLSGFDNIEKIEGDLSVIDNVRLENLNGLNNIKVIKGNLEITDNSKLTNLKGLEGLESINGSFTIDSNIGLLNLNGLESLHSIRSIFTIHNNSSLQNLKGLNRLDFIGSTFIIDKNENFESFEGINTSKSITGIESLLISNNNHLLSLESLETLEFRGIPTIEIIDNDRLETCAVQSTCNYLAGCQNLILLDNNQSDECNDNIELRLSCAANSDINFQLNCISHIYPNPVNNFLIIHFNDVQIPKVKYEIIDMQNRFMMIGNGYSNFIDVSKLMAGVYFLRIIAKEETKVFRFVKN